MERKIFLNDRQLIYTLKISNRAKLLRLAVYRNGRLTITKPAGLKIEAAENFIREHGDWIMKKIKYFENIKTGPFDNLTRRDYLRRREEARILVIERLEFFNHFYNFSYSGVSIRNQKTRWGSCSRRGNLNFNFRLLYLPEPLRDYVIVHELCHLKELNHSANFWALVARTIPDFQGLRHNLRAAS